MESKHNEVDWERLDRYVRKLGTFDELAELERWVESDPALKQLAEGMRTAGRRPNAGASSWDARAAWAEMKQRIRATPVRVLRVARSSGEWRAAGHLTTSIWRGAATNWASAAAVFVFVVGIATLAVLTKARSPNRNATLSTGPRVVATARGERATLDLADGSRVILAAESRLVIPADFGTANSPAPRELSLEGEATFRVRHDATREFRVHAMGASIVDVGTRFDVRAYANDSALSVAVAEGMVKFGRTSSPASAGVGRDTARDVVLRRGDVGRLSAGGLVTTARGVRVSSYFSWTDGQLGFDSLPLPEVLRSIGRWYDLEIRVADKRLSARFVAARFSTQSPSAMLDALASAVGATISREGRVVTLSLAQ